MYRSKIEKTGMTGISLIAVFMGVCLVLGAVEAPAQDAKPDKQLSKPENFQRVPIGRLSTDLNVRTRYEFMDNFNVKGYAAKGNDDVLLLRTQLGVEYRPGTNDTVSLPRLYLQLQDARYWLSELDRHQFPQSCPYFDQLDVRQLFVEWQKIGGSALGFRIGRQNISCRDNRIFGPGDWGNAGRYYWDAGKVMVDAAIAQLDILYGRQVMSEQLELNKRHYDFDMACLYARIQKLPFNLDAFYVLRNDGTGKVKGESGTGDESRHSIGFYIDGQICGWDYRGTSAFQFGSYGQDDILTMGANVRAGYSFKAIWKPRLGAEFSYASGDGDPSDGRCGTFDGVFGAVDLMYGRMNFLSWKNIEDYQLSGSAQPFGKIKVDADYHFFRLSSAADAWYWSSGKSMRRDQSGASGKNLGSELDFVVRWEALSYIELSAGYAHFFPGKFVKDTGDSDHADWLFLQTVLKF